MAAKKKTSFKKGMPARAARDTVAEDLKAKGVPKSSAFAQATTITKGTKSTAAKKRLAKHGLKKKKE